MTKECVWCGARLGWRSRLRLFCGHCRVCCTRAHHEAGIYLQSGGPPFPQGSRRGQSE
jgi:hypothetical protein